MATGLPKKIIDSIEHDVKKALKQLGSPWQGFGPIAEAHVSACHSKVIVIWRQARYGDQKTSFMVGVFHKGEHGWARKAVHPANYEMNSKLSVESRIREEKRLWT